MSGMETVCDDIRELLTQYILALTTKDDETASMAKHLRLLILKLKAEHRQAMDSREELRDKASAARAQLDSTNLELQNFLYEKRVYEGQVRANVEYKYVLLFITSAAAAGRHHHGRALQQGSKLMPPC